MKLETDCNRISQQHRTSMRHPSIPGCVSQGKNEAEEEKNIQEAIKACLESAEKGMPLTVTTRQVEVLA